MASILFDGADCRERGRVFGGRETAKTPPKNKNTAHLARFHPSSTVGGTKPNSSIIYRIDYGAQGESPSGLKKQFKKKVNVHAHSPRTRRQSSFSRFAS